VHKGGRVWRPEGRYAGVRWGRAVPRERIFSYAGTLVVHASCASRRVRLHGRIRGRFCLTGHALGEYVQPRRTCTFINMMMVLAPSDVVRAVQGPSRDQANHIATSEA
jgi:hypothetical protein